MKNKIIERIAYHATMFSIVAFFFLGICAFTSAAEHFPIVTGLIITPALIVALINELKEVYRHGK